MKLRYGIPLMFALLALSSWASGVVPFNVYYLLVGITALAAALDSKRIGIEAYQTQLALPPAAIAALLCVIWPIAFPWYLKVRSGVRTGQIPMGVPNRGISRDAIKLASILALLFAIMFAALWHSSSDLLPVAQQINVKYGVGVNISLSHGSNLILTISRAKNATQRNPQALAYQIARFAHSHYSHPETLNSVRVQLVTVEQRGAVTYTQQDSSFEWWSEQLAKGDSTAPPH